MEGLSLWMALGFLFAAYSVIANDSVQTLGTFIASNKERFHWNCGMAGQLTMVIYHMED